MTTYLRRLPVLIILSATLASCTAGEATLSPTSMGTATAQVTSTEVVKTPTEVAKTATATPMSVQGALIAALGDPVAIGRGGIRDAAFSPDHKRLAIGWTSGVSMTSIDDQIDHWYWEAPELVTAVDTSAEHVVVLLVNGDVWLLDAESGADHRFPEAAMIPGSEAFWGDVAWSPDGRLAAIQAIGGADSGATSILLLDSAAGEMTELRGSQTNPGWEPYLVWSPDSRMIASTDGERRAWVLDVSSGEVVYEAQRDDQGESSRIYAWMPGSTVVVYGVEGGEKLSLVEVTTGEVLREVTDTSVGFVPTPPVVIDPDGDLALVGGYSLGEYEIHPYQVWDLNLGRPLDVPLIGELRHINSAGCMFLDRPAVAFDGKEVIYLDTDGRLVRWKVFEERGEDLGWIPVRYPCLETPMVLSSDSTRLVLETDPGQAVTVWDMTTGELIAERRDGNYPADVHGEVLAYRGGDGNLVLWNIQGNEEIERLPGPVTLFTSGVEFSLDGRHIAYGVGNQLNIADMTTGETVAVLNAYPEEQQISHIVWAPDGGALAAASGLNSGILESPGVLILWDKVGDSFIEAIRMETVHGSYDTPWLDLSLFSPSSQLVALEQLPQLESGKEAILVYDRESQAVILEVQGLVMQQWLSDDVLLVTKGCSFIEVNVRTGEERRARGEGCQAELGAFAPDGVHFSDIVFSGRSVDIMNWRTGLVEAIGYVGSDLQDGIFSPDGRYLLVRAIEGLVRAFPVNYLEAESD